MLIKINLISKEPQVIANYHKNDIARKVFIASRISNLKLSATISQQSAADNSSCNDDAEKLLDRSQLFGGDRHTGTRP